MKNIKITQKEQELLEIIMSCETNGVGSGFSEFIIKKGKKKQQQAQNWQRAKQAELAENQRLAAERQQLTRAGAYSPQVQQDPGGGGTWHQQTAAKEKAGVQVAGPGFGKGAYFAHGGMVDKTLPGRSRDI